MPTLDWLNRANAFTLSAKVPYRLLEQVSKHQAASPPLRPDHPTVRPELVEGSPASTGSARTVSQDNLLIQGDNLEALKALLPFYRGQVKCIFIDPPYNTKSAFEHYDDNLEHAQWLTMMLPRLQLLRELLREDGSIWVTIDDNEGHYLKVMMDEVFGRGNFVANVLWQKRTSTDNRLRLGAAHDHLLVFKKDNSKTEFFNQLAVNEDRAKDFKNPDNDPRGAWASTDFTGMTGHATPSQFYTISAPNGAKHPPPNGRCWALAESTFNRLVLENRVWFGKDGSARPRLKRFLSEMDGQNSWTWWVNSEVGHNQESKKEINELFGADDAFDTPKPERLLQRILHIATNPGDLVLDSFLGSGTTAAVAHKMGRRWIGIEMGEHAATHCLPRLQKVLDGEQGGISKAVNWGQSSDGNPLNTMLNKPFNGGGFRFMRLGDTVFDQQGRINPAVRFATLAAFIWQQETHTALDLAASIPATPHLGTHYKFDSVVGSEYDGYSQNRTGIAYYLLFNGILKDKRPESGNVLTREVLAALLALHRQVTQQEASAQTLPAGVPLTLTVYGEACRLGPERLKQAGVTFKQIPYDVKAR